MIGDCGGAELVDIEKVITGEASSATDEIIGWIKACTSIVS